MILPRSLTTAETGLPGFTAGAFSEVFATGAAFFLGDATTTGLPDAAFADLVAADLAALAAAVLATGLAAGFTALATGLAAAFTALTAARLAADFLGCAGAAGARVGFAVTRAPARFAGVAVLPDWLPWQG